MQCRKSPSMTTNRTIAPGFTVSTPSPACPECTKLNANAELAVKSIRLIVRTRFETLREKLQLLHQWQSARDSAMETLYLHKKSHDPAEAVRNIAMSSHILSPTLFTSKESRS